MRWNSIWHWLVLENKKKIAVDFAKFPQSERSKINSLLFFVFFDVCFEKINYLCLLLRVLYGVVYRNVLINSGLDNNKNCITIN